MLNLKSILNDERCFIKRRFVLVALISLGMIYSEQSWAQPLAESGPAQVSLLEIFSSEGCSSCPPAEEWASRLTQDSRLWKDFVPVIFHVDYWDYLGWRDKLSDSKFSEKQRAYAESWRNGSVYTPGFVLNGKEWRDWHRGGSLESAGKKAVGNLVIEKTKNDLFKIIFDPKGSARLPDAYKVHVALLAFGLVSDVKAGENSGRRLIHDFAVVNYEEKNMERVSEGRFENEIPLTYPKGIAPKKWGIAVWVSGEQDLEPLQAAGSYL